MERSTQANVTRVLCGCRDGAPEKPRAAGLTVHFLHVVQEALQLTGRSSLFLHAVSELPWAVNP